jgi:hypothetical protein
LRGDGEYDDGAPHLFCLLIPGGGDGTLNTAHLIVNYKY